LEFSTGKELMLHTLVLLSYNGIDKNPHRLAKLGLKTKENFHDSANPFEKSTSLSKTTLNVFKVSSTSSIDTFLQATCSFTDNVDSLKRPI
jgi:hypothetical protein